MHELPNDPRVLLATAFGRELVLFFLVQGATAITRLKAVIYFEHHRLVPERGA